MKPFKFKAAAALELRRGRDEAAQRALAVAKAALWEAERRVEHAARGLSEALRGPVDSVEGVTDREWYRNWIAGLRRHAAQTRVQAAARARDVAAATSAAVFARRDLRVIEKYRDRVQTAYLLAVARAEQRALDEFGALQFAARQRVPGGTS